MSDEPRIEVVLTDLDEWAKIFGENNVLVIQRMALESPRPTDTRLMVNDYSAGVYYSLTTTKKDVLGWYPAAQKTPQ